MRAVLGCQTPSFESVPSYVDTSGPEAVAFAKEHGLIALPWQERVLRGGLGETAERTALGLPIWSANEVCVICGRQNGKGFIIEARELAGVFLFREELILHSAHQQRTSNDAFDRMSVIIETNPDLDAQLAQKYRSKGEEGFTFHIKGLGTKSWTRTSRIRYMARTGGAGRGFTKGNCVILDEAMILDSGPVAALLPTMATQEAWQVWYFASQGDIRLPTSSVLLGEVRRRGFRREPTMAFYEWAAHLKHDNHCPTDDAGRPTDTLDVRADPRTWAKANPSMGPRSAGRLISEDFLRKMIVGGKMPKWDADREFLGVGEYPVEEGWTLVPESTWDSLYEPTSRRARRFAVGISVAADQSTSSIAIASIRPDGLWHWELLKVSEGTAWVIPYCKALLPKKPIAFVVDARSAVTPDLVVALGKRHLKHPSTVEYPAWCAKMLQLITETHEGRHIGQMPLNDALKFLEKRDHPSGVFTWQRFEPKGDVTPFDALTLATGGIISKPRRRMAMATDGGTDGKQSGRQVRVRIQESTEGVPGAEAGSSVNEQVTSGGDSQRGSIQGWPQEDGEESGAHTQGPRSLTRHSASLRNLIDRARNR